MSLSTLIVQREIASIREVEEALARQVLYGGDLITNLLEVCRIDEAALLPLVAESLGLPAAPPGELPRPEPEAQRLVAAEVALERNLAPLSVDRYGLTVAVSEPLSAEVEQELAFALALPISQKIAPLVRIKQALARDYGVPLDRRVQRLLKRMTSTGADALISYPPMHSADFRLGAPRPPSILPPAPRSYVPEPVRPSVPMGGGARTLQRPSGTPSTRPLKRRRGAITVDVARTELEEASERDAIFDLLFEFARQYFDYTAVFIVHGDLAEGRDAFGDGASRDTVARVGVPLDLPSILSAVRETKTTVKRVPSADGLDAVLMNDLGLSGKTICIVVPVVVRSRVVAMLLGDGGEEGIDATTLAEVEGMVAHAAAAFERLIVRRKLTGSIKPRGLGDSTAPGGGHSMPPPTKHSEVAGPSARPAIEELAPPIRELMTEPISRVEETLRDPVARAFVPTESSHGGSPNAIASAPPPHVLEVRRPSGRPIPREEPASDRPAPAAPPTSASPRSRAPRGEAPKLDFGSEPAPSSMFADTFGSSDTERTLLAEIRGEEVDSEPIASRVTLPPIAPSASPPSPPSPPSPSPPSPMSHESSPPPSPKAESPPPQRVATNRTTDVSPVALPAVAPPESSEMVTADDADVTLGDASAPWLEAAARPIAPPVSASLFTPWPSSMPEEELASPSLTALTPQSMKPVSSGRPMPASEQQISVALRRPPPPRSDDSGSLPSVIVDVASEYVGLVERVLSNDGSHGESADEAETELLRAGGYAMPAIMAQFPGPVTVEMDRLDDGPLPRVADCGPVLRLVARQRRTALPFVLSHVEDPDVELRFWATYLLTELVYPDVLDSIVARVFDEEQRVRRVAMAAARAFADAHPATIVERLELVAMDGGERPKRRALAIEALGETREALAVPALVPLLDDPDLAITRAVRDALVVITRQDFGTSSQEWNAWWEEHRDRHRLEWLIDALMHEQAALRAAAGEELKATTKEYFGYYDDLPKRERERAQSRYREWWTSVGRVRFSRSAASRG